MNQTYRVLLAVLSAVTLAAVPAAAETVLLRDSSVMNGRLVRVEGDSLTFRLSVGPTVVLQRTQVLAIVFYESAAPAPPSAAGAGATAAGPPGTIEVVFKDRELSSKISIELKKDWDGHVRANHVMLEFVVDGAVAFAHVDTTMDKRIYHGHETQLKNDVEVPDFKVEVPSGLRHCKLVVRSRGGDGYAADFAGDPLNMVLALENLTVRPGEITRLDVGISRGKLRAGKPRFYRVE